MVVRALGRSALAGLVVGAVCTACVGDDASGVPGGDGGAPGEAGTVLPIPGPSAAPSIVDGGADAADGAETGAPSPTSSFCKPRIDALGAGTVVFCADFDDARTTGAWRAGVFDPEAFTPASSRGGVAMVQAGALVIDKPSNAGSNASTGALFAATFTDDAPARGFRLSFELTMTRSNPDQPLRVMVASGGLDFYAEDNNGNPAFVAGSALYGAAAIGTKWQVDLLFEPTGTSGYAFTGSLNGARIKNNAVDSVTVGKALGGTIALQLLASSNSSNDGPATARYDNVIVTKL